MSITLIRSYSHTLILLFALNACTQKQKVTETILPSIPSKTLKDPSSLAYDGESFYIADWMGGGILRLKEGKTAWITLPARPIQLAAMGRAELIIEDYDGKLILWKERVSDGRRNVITEIETDFPRLAGNAFCWDGIYFWKTGETHFEASVLLSQMRLASVPEWNYPYGDLMIPTAELSQLACMGHHSFAILQFSDPEAPNGRWFYAIANTLNANRGRPLKWPRADAIPIAVTVTQDGTLAALAQKVEKPGEYELVLWTLHPHGI